MKQKLDQFLASSIGESIVTVAAVATFLLGIFFFA